MIEEYDSIFPLGFEYLVEVKKSDIENSQPHHSYIECYNGEFRFKPFYKLITRLHSYLETNDDINTRIYEK